MHTFDILFIIGSMFFIIVGVRRGLIGEVFRIIALVAGFLVAFLYFSDLSPYLRFASPSIANPVAFSLIYLATAILILLTGWMLKKIIRLTPLGWVDYSFGGAIGLCKAVILFWIVCLSLSAFPASRAKLNMNRSTVYLTFKKLPTSLKLDGLSTLKISLLKNRVFTLPHKFLRAHHPASSVRKALPVSR